jgi:hypothetical protein
METNDMSVLSNEIDHALSECFQKHKQEIADSNQGFKAGFGLTLTGVLTTTVVALKPSFLSFVPEWLLPMLGSATLFEIINATIQHLRSVRRINNSPVGILWQAKSKYQKDRGAGED